MIALRLVPKVLKAITHIWAPRAFIISFKLETDNSVLEKKSRDALMKYKHQVSLYHQVSLNMCCTLFEQCQTIIYVTVQFKNTFINFRWSLVICYIQENIMSS